jgi:hypothetical protein
MSHSRQAIRLATTDGAFPGDPLIWRYTRCATHRVGGWSLDTIGAIAKTALLARAQAAGMVIAG